MGSAFAEEEVVSELSLQSLESLARKTESEILELQASMNRVKRKIAAIESSSEQMAQSIQTVLESVNRFDGCYDETSRSVALLIKTIEDNQSQNFDQQKNIQAHIAGLGNALERIHQQKNRELNCIQTELSSLFGRIQGLEGFAQAQTQRPQTRGPVPRGLHVSLKPK